jgi:hypothetical protein
MSELELKMIMNQLYSSEKQRFIFVPAAEKGHSMRLSSYKSSPQGKNFGNLLAVLDFLELVF